MGIIEVYRYTFGTIGEEWTKCMVVDAKEKNTNLKTATTVG
jgi:hypothetical protein